MVFPLRGPRNALGRKRPKNGEKLRSSPPRSDPQKFGVGKRCLLEKGSFQKSPFLELLENLEIPEILENPQTVENQGEADHFLEILGHLEILEILEILEMPLVKRPVVTPGSGPQITEKIAHDRALCYGCFGHTLSNGVVQQQTL